VTSQTTRCLLAWQSGCVELLSRVGVVGVDRPLLNSPLRGSENRAILRHDIWEKQAETPKDTFIRSYRRHKGKLPRIRLTTNASAL